MISTKMKHVKKGQKLLRLVESFRKEAEVICKKCGIYDGANSDYCWRKCKFGQILDELE